MVVFGVICATLYAMLRVSVEVTGDLAGVLSMQKQLNFAASRTINFLIESSQKAVIHDLKDDLYVRGTWITPRTRYGINATYSKPATLEGSVHTAADWLLEEEGYNAGVKHTDKGGTHLAEPDVANTRFGIRKKVRADQKAFRLLAGGSFSTLQGKLRTKTPSSRGAFKVKGKYGGADLIYQRVAANSAGTGVNRSTRTGRPLRSRVASKNTRLVLKYTLRSTVRVPQTRIFTKAALKVMNIKFFADQFGKNTLKALRTAR